MADLATLAARVRALGVAGTLRKAFADRIFHRSSSVVLEYRSAWGHVTGSGGVRPDWLEFVHVETPDALPPLGAWLAPRAPAFRAMLAGGQIGIFALREGIAVGCAWIALSDLHDRSTRETYRVAPGEAYHYCWLVDPALRRTNIAIPMCRHMLHYLVGRGIVRQFGVIDRENHASFVIHVRFGYREAGVEVIHYRILGQRFTRMRPYIGTLGLLPIARKR